MRYSAEETRREYLRLGGERVPDRLGVTHQAVYGALRRAAERSPLSVHISLAVSGGEEADVDAVASYLKAVLARVGISAEVSVSR